MNILMTIVQLLIVPVASPLCIGIVRKIKAIMQNRRGASIMQPYYDLWKLYRKNEIISHDASWIFAVAPYIIFTISLIIPLGIPIFSAVGIIPTMGDFLLVIYLLALMTFFLALAGIDTGSAFGGFGSSREMTLTALSEGAFVLSLVPASIMAQSTNIALMVTVGQGLSIDRGLPLVFAFVAFLFVMLSETKRFPFDNPATHLELTMVHEAMILEYSGKRLALLEWASANKFLTFIILGVQVFFPWGSLALGAGLILLAIKVLAILVGVAVLESSIAKYRYFRLPDVLMTALLFAIISLLVMAL